jgi:hypothetical protein
MGIKWYNKVSYKVKKVEKIQEFKRKLNYFLLQHILYSMVEYILVNIIIRYLITMHTFIILVSTYFLSKKIWIFN